MRILMKNNVTKLMKQPPIKEAACVCLCVFVCVCVCVGGVERGKAEGQHVVLYYSVAG